MMQYNIPEFDGNLFDLHTFTTWAKAKNFSGGLLKVKFLDNNGNPVEHIFHVSIEEGHCPYCGKFNIVSLVDRGSNWKISLDGHFGPMFWNF